MGFASAYLKENSLFPELIEEEPDSNTGIIAVIPSFNEPCITRLLDSLVLCKEPSCRTEIIIIINAPADSGKEIVAANNETALQVGAWLNNNPHCFFRVNVIVAPTSGIKKWGVGLARKTGMDEAVRRFDHIGKPDGVIVNIDADCTVKENYFREISKELAENRSRRACSIYFEHPLSGSEFPGSVYKAVTLYELHLRYYFQGLVYSGFPYAYHTVGSAVAVKALPYINVGGMNRKMAGEDFYFIQKLALSGGYFNLNGTTVFPSPRPSLRVPFGTGATISKMFEKGDENLFSYDPAAFGELRAMFSLSEEFFNSGDAHKEKLYAGLPEGIKVFVESQEWNNKITEIKANTSGPKSSIKRFFDWFNMFRIVKYMNFVHSGIFNKKPVEECALELLAIRGMDVDSDDPVSLLNCYRALEKGS